MKSFKSYLVEGKVLTSTGTVANNSMQGLGADGAGDFATRTGAKVSRTSKNKNGPMGFELPTNLNISQTELDKYSGNVYTALSARGAEVRDKETKKTAVDLKSPIDYDKSPSPHEFNLKVNATLNQTLDDIAQQSQSSNNEKMISNWIDGKSDVSSVVKNAVSYKSMIRQLKTSVKKIDTDTQQGSERSNCAPGTPCHGLVRSGEKYGYVPKWDEHWPGMGDADGPQWWETQQGSERSTLGDQDDVGDGPSWPSYPEWRGKGYEPNTKPDMGPDPDPELKPDKPKPKPKPPQINPNFLNPPENTPRPPWVKPPAKPAWDNPPDTAPPQKPIPRPTAPPTKPLPPVGPGNPIVAPSWWWLVPFLIPFPGNPAYGQVGEDVDHSQKPSKRLLTFEEFN